LYKKNELNVLRASGGEAMPTHTAIIVEPVFQAPESAPVRGEHLCMQLRGARKQQADGVTTALRGEFADDEAMEREAMLLLSNQRF